MEWVERSMTARRKGVVATVLATMALLAGEPAVAQDCLADRSAAAPSERGYRLLGDHCEGFLRRFVGNASDVELIGFHRDAARPLKLPPDAGELLVVLGQPSGEPVTLLARSITSRTLYQMDRTRAAVGQPFAWPDELARGAPRQPMPSAESFGILACTDRCASRPATVYRPVASASSTATTPAAYRLVLRSDVHSRLTSVRLVPVGGGTAIPLATPSSELTSDAVVAVPLPGGLAPGRYRLTAEARSLDNDEPMGFLVAVIEVPAASP